MKKYLAIALLLLPMVSFAATDCTVEVANTRGLFNEVLKILANHIEVLSQQILELKAEIATLKGVAPSPTFSAPIAVTVPSCLLWLATTTDTGGNIVGRAQWTTSNARTISINGYALTPVDQGSTRGYTLDPYTGALTLTATVADGTGNKVSTCTASIPAWK